MKTLILFLLLTSPTFGQAYETFWKIYEIDTIEGKKEIWRELDREQQIDVRRMNFAWGIGYLKLNGDQVSYLARLSARLPDATERELADFEDEAIDLFPTGGDLLFGSIGPYRPCNVFLMRLASLQNNCPCSVGSYFNMSCSGDCTAANGRCTVRSSGCGFAWMYSCNGFCQVE